MFDPFWFAQDFCAASAVAVGERKIVQALMIAATIVAIDEGGDFRLQVARQIMVFEQDAVVERLMPALDVAVAPIC